MNFLRSLAILLAVGSNLVPVDGAEERLLRSRFLKKTPDGETPATETVCDGYEGEEFDLCNAFCEAQDCTYNEGTKKSCDKLKEKWEELTDGGRLPCAPTMSPTTSPTMSPTKNPTESPTKNPTESPTKNPTESPTKNPTETPTKNPTESPTSPTNNPTHSPTASPTELCQGRTIEYVGFGTCTSDGGVGTGSTKYLGCGAALLDNPLESDECAAWCCNKDSPGLVGFTLLDETVTSFGPACFCWYQGNDVSILTTCRPHRNEPLPGTGGGSASSTGGGPAGQGRAQGPVQGTVDAFGFGDFEAQTCYKITDP